MVDIGDSRHFSCQPGILYKPRWRIGECASLPGVVGCLTGDEHVRTLGLERFGSFLQVGWEGENRLGDAVVCCAAGFASCAAAIGTPVVCGRQRSTVVMSKFNDYPIAGLDHGCNGIEAALSCV